jgi:hypothetical protein
LESLESLVKLAKKKRDEGFKSINLTKVEGPLAVRKINIHNNSRSKTLHLLIELSNNLLEGLMDTITSMSVMFTSMVHELGIMHLVSQFEAYKMAFGVVTQALGQITNFLVQVGDVQCLMTFMIVHTNSYDLLLGLDFFIKIGAVVDVEKGFIQIKQGLGNNIQVLPLNMVNMLHLVLEDNNMTEENNQGESLRLWGIGPWEPKEWKEKTFLQNQNNSLLDDEFEPITSDEDTIVMVDDGQYDLFLPAKTREVEDLMDNGFENFLKREGPNHIMHLILE